jgi:hypothetical protein
MISLHLLAIKGLRGIMRDADMRNKCNVSVEKKDHINYVNNVETKTLKNEICCFSNVMKLKNQISTYLDLDDLEILHILWRIKGNGKTMGMERQFRKTFHSISNVFFLFVFGFISETNIVSSLCFVIFYATCSVASQRLVFIFGFSII